MVIRRAKQKQISFGYCDTRTGQRVYPPPSADQMSDLLPEQEPPQQLRARDDDAMDVRLTCDPPLGQATTVLREQDDVWFNVLLQRPLHHASLQGWEEPQVSLWHNHNGQHEWEELRLKPTAGNDQTLVVNHSPSSSNNDRTTKTWFAASLSGLPKHGHAVQFTLKWRIGPRSDWNWIRHDIGIGDGELLYRASSSVDLSKHKDHELSHFFSDISSDISISSEEPECANTLLYSLTSGVKPAEGKDSGYSHHRLGKAKHSSRWFALVRLCSPWLAPRHGNDDQFEVDKEGVLLSFLRTDGWHVVCLAISGVEDVLTTFISGSGGSVEIKGRNDREKVGTSRVLVAVAEKFEVASAAVMYHARTIVNAHGATLDPALSKEIEPHEDNDINADWLEEWYDGLTYCTWNGLGQDLTSNKIEHALDELHKNNINITNLIIDDNWQTLSSGDSQFKRGWSDFECNSSISSGGLKELTTSIRKKHPNIQHIAVWHAILGYWGGIDPDGKIAKTYKTIEVEKEPGVAGGKFTVVDPDDAKQMYEDFYAFLKNSGVDAVKTDAQFFLDMLLHAPDRRQMIQEYQDAWTIAHLRHFSSRAISCMSQFPQAIFHSQLPQNRPRVLVRNSDDFFPDVPASHAWHVFCNAHNSLLTRCLNALPDFDMFQTSHDWAAFHAAARCVSGGPIYITDKPGQHDVDLIGSMTAQTVQGKTVILRPSNVGRAMNPYNSYDAQTLLKIGTYVGVSETGSGFLGVFNVTQNSLREFVRLEEFPGTEEGEYVVGSFRLQELSKPMSRTSSRGDGGDNAFVGVELGARGWDILTAYAAHTFTVHPSTKPTTFKVAVLGLLGKMTGAAGTRLVDMYVESNGRLKMWVSLKALGVLGIWISDLESRSVGDSIMVMMYDKVVPVHCVKKSTTYAAGGSGAGVLEIDVATAWKENNEKAGWSNQVELDIFMD